MSHASAVLPLFSPHPLDPAALRRAAQVLGVVAQIVGFAGVLWLAAAGPGFLWQQDSTVAIHRTR